MSVKYAIAAALLGSTLGYAAVAQTLPPEIAERGVVRSALDVPYVPMEFRDPETNELTGFDVELARAMGEILGVTIEYQEGAFETLVPALQSGRVDIIMSGFYDREARREFFDFVNYLRAGAQFFALEDRDDIVELTDLCGKTVSTIRATSFTETVEEFSADSCVAAGLEPITVSPENDVPQMLINLRTGRTDAAMQGLESIPTLMANEPDTYTTLGEPLNSALMGIATRKEDTELRDAFVAALRRTIEDGTYASLIEKYGLQLSAYTEVTVNGQPAL